MFKSEKNLRAKRKQITAGKDRIMHFEMFCCPLAMRIMLSKKNKEIMFL